jgi:hypothetical protein
MLRSKVVEDVDQKRIDRKIYKLEEILQKYLSGFEDISDDKEQEMLSMSMQYLRESVPEFNEAYGDWQIIKK